MERPPFNWDRFTDRHLAFGFAIASAVMGALVLSHSTGDPAARALGAICLTAAAGFAIWGFVNLQSERRRHARLDLTVDGELSDKWAPGFARVVGAYEKPWLLLFGETAVGKTAALRAANLPRAMGPDRRPITDANQGLNGTFLFDWWFFEDAIVLDSAGDLIAHSDQRWAAFLQRVRQARPIQPINGVLIAVSAADLLGSREELRRKADLLARHVEVAREQLRVRFPLYLLVTKSDLITGFADYFPLGSDLKTSFQILGWSNPTDPRVDDRPPSSTEIRKGLEKLMEELCTRRTWALSTTTTSRADAQRRIDHLDEMFAFPDAINTVMDGLEDFVDHLMERAGKGAAPFVRGVYFTSALRTGEELDLELQRLFGLSQPPPTRRSRSDRAFFIRDLLREKVIPESGMVTPLEDVVSGTRRRGRALLGGALTAAVLITAGTIIGYLQTAGQTGPHARFWAGLADLQKKNGGLAEAAVFDKSGQYLGEKRVVGGQTNLHLHQKANELAGQNALTWLLPLSPGLEKDRKATHQAVFRNLVLLPSLTPPPLSDLSRVAPEQPAADKWLGAVPDAWQLYSDTRDLDHATPKDLQERLAEILSVRALPLVPGDADALKPEQSQQLKKVLETGISQAEAANLLPADAKLGEQWAKWVETWLQEGLDRKKDELERSIDPVKQRLTAARDLVEWEKKLLESANEPKLVLPPTAGKPGEAPDLLAFLQTLKVPDEVETLNTHLGQIGPGVEKDLADAIENFRKDLTRKRRELATAAGLTLPADASAEAIDEQLKQFDQLHLGNGSPRILKRLDEYARLATQLNDARSDTAVAARFPDATGPAAQHKFFRLEAALKSVRDDNNNERGMIPGPPDESKDIPATADLYKRFNTFCNHELDVALTEAESRTWDAALKDPASIWPEKDDAYISHVTSAHQIVPTVAVADTLATQRLKDSFSAFTDAETELGKSTDRSGVEGRLNDVKARLHAFAENYLKGWSYVAKLYGAGEFDSLTDLKALETDKVEAALREALEGPRNAIAFLMDANQLPGSTDSLFPDLSKAAKDELAFTKDTGASPSATPVWVFLSSWTTDDPVKTRLDLLANPKLLDERTRLAQAGTLPGKALMDDFWQNLLDHSVFLLVAGAQPAAVENMKAIANAAQNRFPLSKTGTDSWGSDDLGALQTYLDALQPSGTAQLTNRLSQRIRDLDDLMDPKKSGWAQYITRLRQLDGFLRQSHAWEIQFKKVDKHGSWGAIVFQQIDANQVPIGKTPMLRGYNDSLLPKFQIDKGLHAGVKVQLVHSTDDLHEEATITEGGLAQPWSILRLAVLHGLGPFSLGVSDSGNPLDTAIELKLTFGDAGPPELPAAVPDLPH